MSVGTSTDHVIERIDVPAVDDDEMRALAEFRRAWDAEQMPDDPPVPIELAMKRLRNRPPAMKAADWIARDGTEIVGWASLVRWTHLTNPDWREVWIVVRRDRRRGGIGRSLLASLAETCGDGIVLSGDTTDRVDSGGFARRIGAKAGLEARISELRLADVDRALVARWARIDPAGYRLAWIEDAIPDELMDNVLAGYNAMNTAPKGDLSFGEERITADQVRSWERVRHENGGQLRILLAIHEGSGATAGYTELGRHPETPWTIGQHGTAVIPAHRGRGIGKWLKATMIERVFAEWGDARAIRTGNAYVNAPMLAINDRLGFRVTFSATIWEVGIRELRLYLEGRS